MSIQSTPALRLTTDDDEREPMSPLTIPQDLEPADAAGSVACIVPTVHKQLETLEAELKTLREELAVRHRADESLAFSMRQLDEELRLAARIQQDFLPKTMPQVGRVRFHTLFRPASYVSGDLYDVMRLDEKHVGFYMADAVGHGMPAALLTMFIKHSLVTKEILASGYRLLQPGETLTRLNSRLVDQELSNATFATAVYGIVNVETFDVTIGCAGHPNPVVLRPDGTLRPLQAEGGLLGIFPEEVYQSSTARLEAGDRLIVYTDGIEVAFRKDETMDLDRWRGELSRRAPMKAEEMLADFARHLDGESGSLQPKDDLTMLVVEVANS